MSDPKNPNLGAKVEGAAGSFGVAGILGSEAKIYYEMLISSKGVGRVSDLVRAQIGKVLGEDSPKVFEHELAMRACLLYATAEGIRFREGRAPITLECGVSANRCAASASFILMQGLASDPSADWAQLSGRSAPEEFRKLLGYLATLSHRVILKWHAISRRVEIIAELHLDAAPRTTALAAVEWMSLDEILQEAPPVAEYEALGDLPYDQLTRGSRITTNRMSDAQFLRNKLAQDRRLRDQAIRNRMMRARLARGQITKEELKKFEAQQEELLKSPLTTEELAQAELVKDTLSPEEIAHIKAAPDEPIDEKHFQAVPELDAVAIGADAAEAETVRKAKGGTTDASGSAFVKGSAEEQGSALVKGTAEGLDAASIKGTAEEFGTALVKGSAEDAGSARVQGAAEDAASVSVKGTALEDGSTLVRGTAEHIDSSLVKGTAEHIDSTLVKGTAEVILDELKSKSRVGIEIIGDLVGKVSGTAEEPSSKEAKAFLTSPTGKIFVDKITELHEVMKDFDSERERLLREIELERGQVESLQRQLDQARKAKRVAGSAEAGDGAQIVAGSADIGDDSTLVTGAKPLASGATLVTGGKADPSGGASLVTGAKAAAGSGSTLVTGANGKPSPTGAGAAGASGTAAPSKAGAASKKSAPGASASAPGAEGSVASSGGPAGSTSGDPSAAAATAAAFEEAVTVSDADLVETEVAGPSLMEAEVVAQGLVQELESGGAIARFKTKSVELKNDFTTLKADAFIESSLADLMTERSKLNEMAKKITATLRQKEIEMEQREVIFKNLERAKNAKIRSLDRAVKQRDMTVEHMKEQLTQANNQVDKAKSHALSGSGDSKGKSGSSPEVSALTIKLERAQRQMDDLKKTNQQLTDRLTDIQKNKDANGSNIGEVKSKLEAATKMLTLTKKQNDQFKISSENSRKEETRLKAELNKAQTELQTLKSIQLKAQNKANAAAAEAEAKAAALIAASKAGKAGKKAA